VVGRLVARDVRLRDVVGAIAPRSGSAAARPGFSVLLLRG